MFASPHYGMSHTVIDITIQFCGLASFKQELDYFKAVTLIHCSVIALHAEVLEDELGSLLKQNVVEPLKVKLVES